MALARLLAMAALVCNRLSLGLLCTMQAVVEVPHLLMYQTQQQAALAALAS